MSPSTVQPDPRAYVRIAGMVREMISSQVLPPGSPAPSITRLCREHGHARQTCGRAMRLLEDEGTLAAGPGLRGPGPDRRNGEHGPAESRNAPRSAPWNAIRHPDG